MTVSTEPCSARKLGVSNIPEPVVSALAPQSGRRESAHHTNRAIGLALHDLAMHRGEHSEEAVLHSIGDAFFAHGCAQMLDQ